MTEGQVDLKHFRAESRHSLAMAFWITGSFMLVEFVGGLISHSLALLADSGHMLTDSLAIGLSYVASALAARPKTNRFSYGLHRMEILAALVNGVLLLTLVIFIVKEALQRFSHPTAVSGGVMISVALGGLVVNAVCALILASTRRQSLNVRSAFFHVVADMLGSVSTVFAGFLMIGGNDLWADPLASLVIAVIILASAWVLIRHSVWILMEAAPAHVDMSRLEKALLGVSGVTCVHDLHVWTITSGKESLSAHLDVDRNADQDAILHSIFHLLESGFGITHSTVQLETVKRDEHEDIHF